MNDPSTVHPGTPESDNPLADFAGVKSSFPIPSGALKDSARSDRFFLSHFTSDQHAAPHWTRVSSAPKDTLTLPGGIHIYPTYITTLAEVEVEESRKGVREWIVGLFRRDERGASAQRTMTLPNGRVAAEEKEQAVPGLAEGVVIRADNPESLLERAKELFPDMPMEQIGDGILLVRADCRSILEDITIEAAPYTPPKLQYKRVMGTSDRTTESEYTRLVEESLHLPEVWQDVARTLRFKDAQPCLNVRVVDSDYYAAAMTQRIASYESKLENQDGSRRITGIRGRFRSNLNIASDIEIEEDPKEVVVHELGHFLSNMAPYNTLIQEALADLMVVAYRRHNKERPQTVYAGPYDVLEGSPGFNLGDGQEMEQMPVYTDLLSSLGAHILMKCGANDLRTIRKVFEASYVPSRSENSMQQTLTVDEWSQGVDRKIPGFQKKFTTHPALSLAQSGKHMVWLRESESPSAGKDAWGKLCCYDLTMNPKFGTAKVPPHLKARIEDFNMTPGTVRTLPFTVHTHRKGEPLFEWTVAGGLNRIKPEILCDIYGRHLKRVPEEKELLHLFRDPFSVKVKREGGEWKTLGDNFYFDENDIQRMRTKLEELRTKKM